jgi:hypothetical protein
MHAMSILLRLLGAWLGGWCRERVIADLRAAGHGGRQLGGSASTLRDPAVA